MLNRNPNHMRLEILELLLPDLSRSEILVAIETLKAEGLVLTEDFENTHVPGRWLHIVGLPKPTNYPMVETIKVGRFNFPRLIHGDLAGGEDINMFVEALEQYDASIYKRVERLTADLTQRYWTNIATLFGLFVAVFAIVLRVPQPLTIQQTTTPWDLFVFKFAQVVPLAIVLFAFVVVLRFLLAKL